MAVSKNRKFAQIANDVAADGTLTAAAISSDVTLGGATIYASRSNLPTAGNTAGDQAFTTDTNRLYIWNGSGWYNVALLNVAPSIQSVTDSNGTTTPFRLSLEGAITTITITANDSDGDPITYAASADSDFSGLATVSQADNVFTITPFSQDSATTESGTITFTATDGVNVASSGVQTFTLQFLSPYWDETVVSIGTSSTNGLDNSTFVDRSTNAHTVTPTGTPTQTAFHPYLNAWSNYTAATSYLSAPNHADFNLSGNVSFTIEAWVYRTGSGTKYWEWVAGKRATSSPYPFSWSFGIGGGTSGLNRVAFGDNTSSVLGTTELELNRWHHIAASYDGTTCRVFLDGVLENSGSQAISEVNIPLTIGNYTVDNQTFEGYISNLRLVKGTCLYTTNFTPSTEPLDAITNTVLLTCQSNRFIDNGSTGHTLTLNGDVQVKSLNPFGQGSEYAVGENKGSVYLNGSSYMTLATSPFHMDQSDYTAECWIYPTVLGRYIMGIWSSTSASNQAWSLRTLSDGKINSEIDPGDVQIATSSAGIIKLNQWHHVALTRSGGDFRIFVDGDLVASGSSPGFNMAEGGGFMGIGAVQGLTGSPFTGYISDVYIRKGAAKYTSAFTIPTAPVQNTDATLYLPMDNAGIFDKTANNTLTLNGVVASTTQTKFANTAIYFDGSNDTIEIPNGTENNPKLLFMNSNWTMEAWVYKTSAVNAHIFSQAVVSTLSTGSDGKLQLQVFRGSNYVLIASAAGVINVNTWHHVALTCDGSYYRMWVDGTQVATGAISPVAPWSDQVTTQPFVIGRYTYNNTNYWPGYMENIQLNPNICKYTTTFTPPDATQGRIYQAES